MIRIIVVLFVAITLVSLFSCTIDQGEGTFDVDAEITGIGNTFISVKYYIGETIVFDDIMMKNNMGILNMIYEEKPKIIPLKIHISFYTTNEPTREGFLKYYYGANFLAESKSFDVDSLILVAKANQSMFSWKYMNEEIINEKEEKTIESMSSETVTPTKPPVKEEKL